MTIVPFNASAALIEEAKKERQRLLEQIEQSHKTIERSLEDHRAQVCLDRRPLELSIIKAIRSKQLDQGFAVDPRGKDSRGKRPPDTETEIVVPDAGGVPAAVGRAEVLRIDEPGTAANDTATAISNWSTPNHRWVLRCNCRDSNPAPIATRCRPCRRGRTHWA